MANQEDIDPQRLEEIREKIIKDLKGIGAVSDPVTVDRIIKGGSTGIGYAPSLLDELYPPDEVSPDPTS